MKLSLKRFSVFRHSQFLESELELHKDEYQKFKEIEKKLKFRPKTSFREINKDFLVRSNKSLTPNYMGREDALINFLSIHSDRLSAFIPSSNLKNPYVYTSCGPGGGKSRFILETFNFLNSPYEFSNFYLDNLKANMLKQLTYGFFSKTREDLLLKKEIFYDKDFEEIKKAKSVGRLEMVIENISTIKDNYFPDPTTIQIFFKELDFHKVVPIPVSFIHIDNHHELRYLTSREYMCIYILYSYLASEMNDFTTFAIENYPLIRDFLQMKTKNLIGALMIDATEKMNGITPFFYFAIDEFVKIALLDKNKTLDDLMQPITNDFKSLIERFPNFIYCVTSLNYQKLYDYTSGRTIKWIELKPLDPWTAEAMFTTIIKDQKDDEKKEIIRRLVVICSGHPRSLESLSEILLSKEPNLHKLTALLVNKYRENIVYIKKDLIISLIASVFAKPRSLNSKLNRKAITFQTGIEKGLLLNSLKASEEEIQIPKVSLLLVQLFLDEEFMMSGNDSFIIKSLEKILKRINEIGKQLDEKIKQDGDRLELLYINWEVLKRMLVNIHTDTNSMGTVIKFKAMEKYTIQQWFGDENVFILVKPEFEMRLKIAFPSLLKNEITKGDGDYFLNLGHAYFKLNYNFSEKPLVFETSNVYRTVEGNPGFDSISFFVSETDDIFTMVVDNKFNSEKSVDKMFETAVDLDEFIKKYVDACFEIKAQTELVLDEEIKKYYKGRNKRSNSHYITFCKVSKKLSFSGNLTSNFI